ncbi:hypothetical protein [Chroococcus sp. FPU101]|uniref:hypothetical protein n=1 Tax=Chroococcus sp. FPU101 TaxID=1974212 RepID=UPI001A8C3955|nr:hypothetical protein [Chroococcus sp. FPU101]GFE69604.1 hypothetical protein CFPU101_22140 [Chroococcus sp. FPU101]
MLITTSKFSKIILANLIIALIFIAIVIPGIIYDKSNSFQAIDQNYYHLPQVEIFVKDSMDFGKLYPSKTATTPGYHLALSWVAKTFNHGQADANAFPVRLVNALFGLGLLLSVWWLIYLGGNNNIANSTYLVLPFLFSYQFLGSSIWVMTDNASLLWVTLTLLLLILPISLNRDHWTLSLAGIFASLAVFYRQTHIWLIVPTLLRLLKSSTKQFNGWLYLLALLPACLVLGYFLALWHGLLPPEFVSEHISKSKQINWTVLPFVSSLFAIFSLFYTGYLVRELKEIKASELYGMLIISLIIGLSLAILFPSNYDKAAGRYGGWLWILVKSLPTVQDRSILFLFLSPLGTVLMSLWYKVTTFNKNSNDLLILFSMIAWTIVGTSSMRTYQRYYEPLILITLAFLASRQMQYSKKSYLGSLILTGLMATISLQQILLE